MIEDFLLGSVFDSGTTMANISAADYLLCAFVALVLGLIIGYVSTYKDRTSKSFIAAMGLLPVIVQTVILLVNGNMGAAVAVFGVFSLVRFRSMPGSAKDIVTVFEAMAVGLACGMGFIGLACLMTLIVSVATVIYTYLPENMKLLKENPKRILKMVVPEDIDYDTEFNETLDKHCISWQLESIETTNMGSLYQLQYEVELKDASKSKTMIDDLRCLNGNLRITLNSVSTRNEQVVL